MMALIRSGLGFNQKGLHKERREVRGYKARKEQKSVIGKDRRRVSKNPDLKNSDSTVILNLEGETPKGGKKKKKEKKVRRKGTQAFMNLGNRKSCVSRRSSLDRQEKREGVT